MPCELEDLMMSSIAELSSCCVLVATCPELVFSCSIVVRRVLEAVLDHYKFTGCAFDYEGCDSCKASQQI